MEKISQCFDEFKKNSLPYLRENLICIIIFTNSFAVLFGNIFVWIIKRNNIERALVYILEFFFSSILVITSGIITVIIVSFFINYDTILKFVIYCIFRQRSELLTI